MMRNVMSIILLTAGMFMLSCKKSTPDIQTEKETDGTVRNDAAREGEFCDPTVVQLTAGQNINAGTITVTNDESFIYVTYSSANDYLITETHLYVGPRALIPTNKPGNPIPGQFPYGNIHSNVSTYTYAVPISAIPVGSCGAIAAHCVVKKFNASGNAIESQTGWGQGSLINLSGGNWGMAFDFCPCSEL